jgi:hypothetical protein
VELLFGAGAQPGTYALLVTPAGGATVHITDLTVP